MKTLEVELGPRSYRIEIERGFLKQQARRLVEVSGPGKSVIITDHNVEELYAEEVKRRLTEVGKEPLILSVPAGESSKSLSRAESLYRSLLEHGVRRDGTIIALGGGVVGDLAGFVAATYLRGVRYVQVPTTLLAQVDSSVGGKTAINLAGGKNLVGAFYQPVFVAIDPSVLRTLSEADLRGGYGEIAKYGLIRDYPLFKKVTGSYESLIETQNSAELGETIFRCCQIKAQVVSQDEKDRGIRQILNFGHTIGHGIESIADLSELKHGEAVLWGMIGESWISFQRGYLSREGLSEIVRSLRAPVLPALPGQLTPEKVLKFVQSDKKNRKQELRSVLLREPGRKARVEKINSDEVVQAIDFIKEVQRDVDSDIGDQRS
ncbi:MAG: 3-dehydroquinate synthase [Candidatus Acetothermia bacterium]